MVKQPIKTILTVENVLGFYRNYTISGRIQRFFMTLRTIIEISLIVFYFATFLIFGRTTNDPLCWYYLASVVYSFTVLVLSIYHSKNFRKWLRYNKIFDNFFQSDKVYRKQIIILNRNIWLYTIIINFIEGSTVYLFMYGEDLSYTYIDSWYYEQIFSVMIVICDYRVLFELPVMYCFNVFTAMQIDCITRSIDDYIKQRKQLSHDNGPRGVKLQIFDKWSASYVAVGKKTKLCCSIFGFQLTMTIGLVTIFYILLMYMITLGLKKDYSPERLVPYIIALSEFMISLFILVRATQSTLDSVETLKRRLGLLYNLTVECERECKAARDLLRQMRSHPIEMCASGSIAVNMRLLPALVSFCTTYTVVALQFNNIL